jgi:predicted lipoprotein with Yx(FWY)xxD motif
LNPSGAARLSTAVFMAAFLIFTAGAQAQKSGQAEAYIQEPMPAGFTVVSTDVDGPLFTDATGHILYTWPQRGQRNGQAGEQQGKPTCDDTHIRVNTGFMSPYPGGLELPEVDSRPTCIQQWPAVYAADDAKPVGKWTILARKDGRKQWAYEGYAVYTSVLDREPGVPVGSGMLRARGDSGVLRVPIGPSPDIPAQFSVATTRTGRLLVLDNGPSIYTWDKDGANKSNCGDICLRSWEPVLAAKAAPLTRGDWGVIERSPGIKQWTFRKKPLYTRIADVRPHSFDGSDIPGWHNVYTQAAPQPPKGFTLQDTGRGQVLADAGGRTLYTYTCTDDAADQQQCDHPSQTQAYRYTVCGGGDQARCLATFPYVIADKNAKSDSKIWSVVSIDPKTGTFAKPDQANALHVWAYRERPIYTFARDRGPGDTRADSWGEGNGWRNGFHAIWMRDQFSSYNE